LLSQVWSPVPQACAHRLRCKSAVYLAVFMSKFGMLFNRWTSRVRGKVPLALIAQEMVQNSIHPSAPSPTKLHWASPGVHQAAVRHELGETIAGGQGKLCLHGPSVAPCSHVFQVLFLCWLQKGALRGHLLISFSRGSSISRPEAACPVLICLILLCLLHLARESTVFSRVRLIRPGPSGLSQGQWCIQQK
jgi:hypothetical protein